MLLAVLILMDSGDLHCLYLPRALAVVEMSGYVWFREWYRRPTTTVAMFGTLMVSSLGVWVHSKLRYYRYKYLVSHERNMACIYQQHSGIYGNTDARSPQHSNASQIPSRRSVLLNLGKAIAADTTTNVYVYTVGYFEYSRIYFWTCGCRWIFLLNCWICLCAYVPKVPPLLHCQDNQGTVELAMRSGSAKIKNTFTGRHTIGEFFLLMNLILLLLFNSKCWRNPFRYTKIRLIRFILLQKLLTFGGLEDHCAWYYRDTSGNFYVVGIFLWNVRFWSHPGGTDEQTSEGGNDVFLQNTTQILTIFGQKLSGGTNTDMADAVVTIHCDIYLTGCFWKQQILILLQGTDEFTTVLGVRCISFQKFDSGGIISGQRFRRNRLWFWGFTSREADFWIFL